MSSTTWTQRELRALSERFEQRTPEEILRWGYETFGEGMVMGTGFGYSGVALMHLVSTVQPGATVFYIDTELLFPETYSLRDRLAEELDVNIVRVGPALSLDEQEEVHGPELWTRNPDQCCFLRKVLPLQQYLSDKEAWVTALRRDQAPTRAGTEIVEWNASNEVVKINPIAGWTASEVWAYIHAHDLPYNPLHDEGYPSIGCVPCTEPVSNGDGERAGRWYGRAKTECGLHLEPQAT